MSTDRFLRDERVLPSFPVVTDILRTMCFVGGVVFRDWTLDCLHQNLGCSFKCRFLGPRTGSTEPDSPDRRSGNLHFQPTFWESLSLAKM